MSLFRRVQFVENKKPEENENMKTADTAVEIPNFGSTEVQKWSRGCTDTRIVFAYFKYLRERMRWLETEGEKMLESKDPWTKEDFDSVVNTIWHLMNDIPELEPFDIILRLVLKKGIASLTALAKAKQIGSEEADLYLRGITYFLETGGPCEMGGKGEEGSKDSAGMIDSLVPVAQFFKDENMLGRIARCRICGWVKALPLELYVKHFKNW